MAFTTPVFMAENGLPCSFYNIDYPVGATGYNRHEDVMLVQALFRILYYELGGTSTVRPPPGESGIAVDGYFGAATNRHIVQFKQQMTAMGGDFGAEGELRLDPFRTPGQRSTVSNHFYLLDILNDFCHDGCTRKGLNNFSHLGDREDVPAALRSALKTVKSEAARYIGSPPAPTPAIGPIVGNAVSSLMRGFGKMG